MTNLDQKSHYLFGDSDLAGRRLELLAHVFENSTRAFLLKAAGGSAWRLAVDLGCGPGLTTRLIAEALQCDAVAGFDSSESFINLARAAAPERTSFATYDVTGVPFPCGSTDIVFCRFLLTHLNDPIAIVAQWAAQVRRGGLMMLEETETIRTAHPVFARYLQIVEAMLASQANRLYAGTLLGTLESAGDLKPVLNELRTVPVRNCDAAAMFVLNMQAWKDCEFVRANYSRQSILELETTLRRIAEEESPPREILWEMRQAAFRHE